MTYCLPADGDEGGRVSPPEENRLLPTGATGAEAPADNVAELAGCGELCLGPSGLGAGWAAVFGGLASPAKPDPAATEKTAGSN